MSRSFLLRPALAPALVAVVGIVVNAAYVAAGFTVDDFALLGIFREDPLPFSRWRGVWSVQEVSLFSSLWYFGDGWEGSFWRPIPSLLIEGSLRLFGETAAPIHALAIACHAWIGAAIFLLVRGLTGRQLPAFLAGLFFVGSDKVGMVVGWVATVTDPICVSFVMASLLAQARWLRTRSRSALAVSLVTMALAFPCKESAVLAPVLLGLLAFFAPNGTVAGEPAQVPMRERVAGFARDWPSWLPGGLLLVAYLAAYRALDLGRMHNLFYVSPLQDPAAYLSHLLLHLPAMWLGTLSPFWPSFTMFDPRLLVPAAAGGVLALLGLLAALWPLRRDPLVQFCVVAWNLVLLPQMGADASERGMYLPMAMAAPMLAALVVRIGFVARRVVPGCAPAPLWTRLCGWWAALGVLAPGMAMALAMAPMMVESNAVAERQVATSFAAIEARRPEAVVILTTPGMMAAFYPHPIINLHFADPVDVRVLSSVCAAMSVERTGDRAFVLRADRPGWLSNMFARLVRTDPLVRPGMAVPGELFDATILEATAAQDDALAVRFEFRRPLSDEGLLFLAWDGTAYAPLDLGSLALEEERILFDASNVWASMM